MSKESNKIQKIMLQSQSTSYKNSCWNELQIYRT